MMHNSSRDMIAFVGAVGNKLKTVTTRYMRCVDPDLPNAKQSRIWLKAFLEVNERFGRRDFRHTSRELGQIGELAQWLINLHAVIEKASPKQLTINESDMIVVERIVG